MVTRSTDGITTKPVGVFDFGIGGLTVMREIIRILPHENIIFLNDNANLWAGYKSEGSVKNDTAVANRFLLQSDVKAVVIACNTATAVALGSLKDSNHVPTVGVIEPAAKAALKRTASQRIGVIGTNMTIRSNAYPTLLKELNLNVNVISQSCPLLVPMIEEGFVKSEAIRLVAMEYLKEFWNKEIDTLILGCTHYSLITPIIASVLPNVSLVDPAPFTAEELRQVLIANNSLNPGDGPPKYTFLATDVSEKSNAVANITFSKEFPAVRPCFEEVDLNN